MSERDWEAWHAPYTDPESSLSRRLSVVQGLLGDALDAAPPGPISLVSACAGQGHDILGVVPTHRRGEDVQARLVEGDERNVAVARRRAVGHPGIEVVHGDAGITDAYVDAVPARVVLVCGVFGNITDDDIRTTIDALPMLCAAGATVLWTRHRREPDKTPAIARWFADAGFEEVASVRPPDTGFCVGAHRFAGAPQPFGPGHRLFTFVGFDRIPGS